MAAPRHLLTIAAAVVALVVVCAGPRAAAGAADDEDDCVVARQAFSECLSYVTGTDASAVTPRCCAALVDVRDMGGSPPRRRALCRCILSELLAAGEVVSSRAAGLPAACKVPRIGFIPTSPGFDCAAIR